MRNPQGYLVITTDDAQLEYDTATCCHCNRVWVPRDSPGGFCMRCMKMTCEQCAAQPACTPLLQQLERAEARSRFLASVGLEA